MENQNEKFVLWLTGLSGSGKTTLSIAIKKELDNRECKSHHLDGDEVREAHKVKLGFSKEDRDKNINMAITLAKQYQDKDCSVIASFISPYRLHRDWGKEKLENFIEVFVDCPLEVCENRDVKGLYKKARTGEIKMFTGIDDPYECPEKPHIRLRTDQLNTDECATLVIKYLQENGIIE